jgi:hypothetical protein
MGTDGDTGTGMSEQGVWLGGVKCLVCRESCAPLACGDFPHQPSSHCQIQEKLKLVWETPTPHNSSLLALLSTLLPHSREWGGVSPHPSFCHNPLSPSLSPRVSDSAASPSSPLSPWRLLGGTRRGTPQPCACCHPQFFPGVHSCALQNLGFKHPECQPLAPSTGLRPAL